MLYMFYITDNSIAAVGEDVSLLHRLVYMYLITILTRIIIFSYVASDMPRIVSVLDKWEVISEIS